MVSTERWTRYSSELNRLDVDELKKEKKERKKESFFWIVHVKSQTAAGSAFSKHPAFNCYFVVAVCVVTYSVGIFLGITHSSALSVLGRDRNPLEHKPYHVTRHCAYIYVRNVSWSRVLNAHSFVLCGGNPVERFADNVTALQLPWVVLKPFIFSGCL